MNSLFQSDLQTARNYFEGHADDTSEQIFIDAVVEAVGNKFFNGTDVGFAEMYSRVDFSAGTVSFSTDELGFSEHLVAKLMLASVQEALAAAGYTYRYAHETRTTYIDMAVPMYSEKTAAKLKQKGSHFAEGDNDGPPRS